jgi:CubicO group peptidase (beta-lactamase class C family)
LLGKAGLQLRNYRRIGGLLTCFTLVGLECGAQTNGLGQKREVAGAIEVLDAWLQATTASREEPGLSIGVVYNQDLIWSKDYGFANFEKKLPASAATVYRIASISKVFTATAIMQLRDAGKLQLDDPVSKHLSWFHVKEPRADAPPITIWSLLTHTSGMARELPAFYWNDFKFPTREEMMRMTVEEPAVFPPETEYKYSNLALAIAGEVVAAVSGEPYAQYVENHILRPLGMSSTSVTPQPGDPNLAVGYRRRVLGQPREAEDFIDARALTPSAGLASNVNDLAKFVSLQFRDGPAGGSQILKGPTLREMQRVQWLKPDWQSAQGLGFGIRHVGQQVRVGKDGAAPGYKSLIEWVPAEKFGVIVLINGYDAEPTVYVNQALSIMGPAIAKAMARPKPVPEADPAWTNYTGTYEWKHVENQIMIVDGELIMISPEAATPWESRVRLAPAGPQTFKMVGGGSDGELLKFEVDQTGKATRFATGSYYRIRKQ